MCVTVRSHDGSSAFYFCLSVSVVTVYTALFTLVFAMAKQPLKIQYLLDELCAATKDDILCFKWDRSISQVTPNKNGISGWATTTRSLNGTTSGGNLIRVHVCAHDPCKAIHPDCTYGAVPIPIHCRFIQAVPPSDLSTLAAASAVAGPSPPVVVDPPPTDIVGVASAVAEPCADVPEPHAEPIPVPGAFAIPLGEPPLTPLSLPPTPPYTPLYVGPPTPPPPAPSISCGGADGHADVPTDDAGYSSDATPMPDAFDIPLGEPPLPPPALSPTSPYTPLYVGPPTPPLSAFPCPVVPTESIPYDAPPSPTGGAGIEAAVSIPTHAPPVADLKCHVDGPTDVAMPAGAPLPTDHCPAVMSTRGNVSNDEHTCPTYKEVVRLATELRTPNAAIGHYAILLFCLYYRVRMNVWHGATCTDLIATYAPWAEDRCSERSEVDAIFCRYSVHPETGIPTITAMSADLSLYETCNHYVAARKLADVGLDEHQATDFEQLYIKLGVLPVPTVADGNCGVDVMLQSLELAQTADEMQNMRNRLADYLMSNAGSACLILTLQKMEPTQGAAPLPAVAGSINADDAPAHAVAGSYASCANDPSAHADGGPDAKAICACDGDAPGHGADEAGSPHYSDHQLHAVQWASGITDASLRTGKALIAHLPDWAVRGHVLAYEHNLANMAVVPAKSPKDDRKRIYFQRKLSTRIADAKEFRQLLRSIGVPNDSSKWPRGLVECFMQQSASKTELLESYCNTYGRYNALKKLRGFFSRSLASLSKLQETGMLPSKRIISSRGSDSFKKRYRERQRLTNLQGRPEHAPEVGEALFEWWSSIRFSIDAKVMTRIPRSVIKCKAEQLKRKYVLANLEGGHRCKTAVIGNRWIRNFEKKLTGYRICRRPLQA